MRFPDLTKILCACRSTEIYVWDLLSASPGETIRACVCFLCVFVCVFVNKNNNMSETFFPHAPVRQCVCVCVCVCLLIITIGPGPVFRKHRRDNIHVQTVHAHGQGEGDKVTKESDRGQGDDSHLVISFPVSVMFRSSTSRNSKKFTVAVASQASKLSRWPAN